MTSFCGICISNWLSYSQNYLISLQSNLCRNQEAGYLKGEMLSPAGLFHFRKIMKLDSHHVVQNYLHSVQQGNIVLKKYQDLIRCLVQKT